MRGVTNFFTWFSDEKTISTHTPHARRDLSYIVTFLTCFPFQLTRLMRGVTMDVEEIAANPAISTHTPHARRDRRRGTEIRNMTVFQLTRLMRGVTKFMNPNFSS